MQNGVKLRMNSSVNIKMLNESLNSKTFDLANYLILTQTLTLILIVTLILWKKSNEK